MRGLPKKEADILADLTEAGYELWDIAPDGVCLRSHHGPLILNAQTWRQGLIEAHSLVWGRGEHHRPPRWPKEEDDEI